MTSRDRARVLTAVQVARFCGVDLKTIHNWTNKGRIAATRTAGRHLRFRRLDVVDFLRAHGWDLPAALKHARPRVAAVDSDPQALASVRRALARRFDVVTFEHAVDALVAIAAVDPDVVVLGDVAPIDASVLAARLRKADATRHVRIVALGSNVVSADETVARSDVSKLRDALESITGIE